MLQGQSTKHWYPSAALKETPSRAENSFLAKDTNLQIQEAEQTRNNELKPILIKTRQNSPETKAKEPGSSRSGRAPAGGTFKRQSLAAEGAGAASRRRIPTFAADILPNEEEIKVFLEEGN